MKAENVVNIDLHIKKAETVRYVEAQDFVNSIWEEIKALAGGKQGKIIDITEPNDAPWLKMEEFKKLPKPAKQNQQVRTGHRMKLFMRAVREKMKGGFVGTYKPCYNYIGGGKVIFWWRFRRPKTAKKVNGTT